MAGLVAETNPTADGTVRARAMPYTGWAGFSYDAALPREQLKSVLLAAARADIRILSMGAGLLDLYEDVNRVVPIRDRRWVIEHIGILTADEIGRIRDLGVVLTTHTNRYLYKEGDLFRAQVGSNAEDTIVPLRRLKEAGVHVALATDNVPPSLFLPVWQAVARVDRSTNRVIAPAQRLSRADALRAATLEGAYVTFEEDQKGSIEPGKLADLAVLSDDPMTCAEDRIRDITAEMTIVGGRIVHERGRPRRLDLPPRASRVRLARGRGRRSAPGFALAAAACRRGRLRCRLGRSNRIGPSSSMPRNQPAGGGSNCCARTPAPSLQAELVQVGNDDSVVLARAHPHRVLARALAAFPRKVAGAGAGFAPVVLAAAHQ